MYDFKKIDVSRVMIVLVFVSSIVGLSFLNNLDLAESYSDTLEAKKIEKSTLTSQNEIVRTFYEIDTKLMSFFDELREDLSFDSNR